MPNITLSVPETLWQRMQHHQEFKWSIIAREAFERKIKECELLDKLLSNSELTEADAERIGHKIKAGIRKRFDAARH